MIKAYCVNGKPVEAESLEDLVSRARSTEDVFMIVFNEGQPNEQVSFTRNLNGTWCLEDSRFDPNVIVHPNQGAFNV